MLTIGTKIDEVRIDGSLYRFRSDLNKISAMGIKAVELPVHGLDLILNGGLNIRRMGEVINIITDFDFKYSIHSPNPLNLMDTADPAIHFDVFLATLEFARQIKATAVVYHAGRFIPEETFHSNKNVSVSDALKNELLEKEAEALRHVADQYPDVMIAVENARPYIDIHQYTYGESIDALKKQILKVDRDNVRINLDFGHLNMTSSFYGYDLLDAVRSIRDLVAHTHIHDNFGGAVHHWEKQQTHQLPFGRGDSHMPVGWGAVPIREILDILLPSYNGLLMMELRSRYFNDIVESANNLKTVLNQLGAVSEPEQMRFAMSG